MILSDMKEGFVLQMKATYDMSVSSVQWAGFPFSEQWTNAAPAVF
jgi:hypothetical protein